MTPMNGKTTGAPAEDAPIIIAGAGPVGLSLALGLARRGVRSIVLEKEPALKPFSRAVLMLTRTLQIMRGWGAWDAFIAAGEFHREVTARDARNSRPIFSLHLDSLNDLMAEPGVLFIPQDRTEHLLLDLVRATGLCDLRFATAVTGFREDEHGIVVTTKSSTGDGAIRGRYLVGCDGAHSVVREGLGLTLEGQTYKVRMVLADVSFPDRRADLPSPRIALNAAGLLLMIRFDDRRWRVISTIHADESDEHAVTHDAIAGRVRLAVGEGPFELLWSSAFRIHCRNAARFRIGRVILAGDAAHLNSPAGGMGMNGGIQDAQNLAWKLAAVTAGGDAGKLLDSYERERRSAVIGTLERVTDRLTWGMLYPPVWLRRVLIRSFGLIARMRWVQRRAAIVMSMMNTRYPVEGAIGGDARWAGRIVRDCPLGNGGRRLLDGVEGTPVIICHGITAPELAGWRAVVVREDEAEAFRRIWRVRGPFCAIIRPDGYVAWAMKHPTPAAIAAAAERSLCVIPGAP